MSQRAVILDTETVPDLDAGRRLLDLGPEVPDAQVRQRMADHCRGKNAPAGGDVFIKTVLQKMVAVSAIELVREQAATAWTVKRIVSGHVGRHTEEQCLVAVAGLLQAEPQPVIVGWNTSGFDMPLLRYRTLALRVAAPALNFRFPSEIPAWKWPTKPLPLDYWKKYADAHVDLMEVLANWQSGARAKIVEVAAALGLPGKAGGVDGSKVEDYVNQGRIAEVSAYCEGDVGLLLGIWLRYQLACGDLTPEAHAESWASFAACVRARSGDQSHLSPLVEVADREVAMLSTVTA